jgi:hypothetical protein
LFSTHWAGKSDVRHLQSKPRLQQGLTFCPAYNGKLGCCTASFEEQLHQAFRRWVKHWMKKHKNLQHFQIEMTKMKISRFYESMDRLQKALFDGALKSLAPVLDWHGTCFDVLLEYMAGMLCFACDPDWKNQVFMASEIRSVAHLHIAEYSNEALWQGCRNLGSAWAEMQTRVADSMLTKAIKVPSEDLSMFNSKITVSHYMARLGLYPMRPPNENTLEVIPKGRLLGARPQRFINPVLVGRASGFKTTQFPKRPVGTSAALGTQPLFFLVTAIYVGVLESCAS